MSTRLGCACSYCILSMLRAHTTPVRRGEQGWEGEWAPSLVRVFVSSIVKVCTSVHFVSSIVTYVPMYLGTT